MLNHKAMLMTLSISQWTARKHDKHASSEIEKSHGAKNAGRFNKLLVDADALARGVTLPGGAAIAPLRAAFGSEFIDASGALDRARMRALAFATQP